MLKLRRIVVGYAEPEPSDRTLHAGGGGGVGGEHAAPEERRGGGSAGLVVGTWSASWILPGTNPPLRGRQFGLHSSVL